MRAIYHANDAAAGRRQAERLLTSLAGCPVPEVARLGRTLRAWRTEFCAYFDTDRVSNGPTEAMNLLIEKIRRIGHGYRNFANYRLRLLLHWRRQLAHSTHATNQKPPSTLGGVEPANAPG